MFANMTLHPRLVRALDAVGMQQPTPVQQQAIPAIAQGSDVFVQSQTGSGKTAAFVLPILHNLMTNPADSGTQALILVPTRELAQQVFQFCKQMASYSKVIPVLITGGESFRYQRALLRKDPEIIIATPGRLQDHLNRHSVTLEQLQVLVLDEADRMLDMGFGDEVLDIVQHCPTQRQVLLFSATLGHAGVNRIARQITETAVEVTVDAAQGLPDTIDQHIILSDDRLFKERLLVHLLKHQTFNKVLVFTNTRLQAQKLGIFLTQASLHVGVLQGEMKQDERNQVMRAFRHGKLSILLATDVAARGLDIAAIDWVINFDMARTTDDYIHRIGRTGRAGELGTATSLIADHEWNVMVRMEHALGRAFVRRTIKGYKAHYKGPKKLKSSGKAASPKVKKSKKSKVSKPGTKRTHAKRVTLDGHAPLRRRGQ